MNNDPNLRLQQARLQTQAIAGQNYNAALAQRQRDDAALKASLGDAKNQQIDGEVRRNTAQIGTSTLANDQAVRDVKAQLDRAQTDPERLAILERTIRTALPTQETPEQRSTLESRQRFVQDLAAETGRDPKLQAISRKVLLDEADLRSQRPSVQALSENPPRATGDPNAARELQNSVVLATSALDQADPDQRRALVSSLSTDQAMRLGRTLTVPIDIPNNDVNSPTSSVRRQVLTSTLDSMTSGQPTDSTRAFTRAVATNIRSADLPFDRSTYNDDRGPLLDTLGKAWGHQVAPNDPNKAALHEKVLQRGLDQSGEASQIMSALDPQQRQAYINGLLDDPANFAFAHPNAVNLRGDPSLQRVVARETTARWSELTELERRHTTDLLENTMNTRQGQDLLLSDKLPPEMRAQYLDYFRRNPAARTDINGALASQNLDVYDKAGRTQTQPYPPNVLENALGTSLGLRPDARAAQDPASIDQALRSNERSFYTEGASGDVVQHLAGRIREAAGTDTPQLRMIPVQFASATSGSQTTMVYGVLGKDGRETFLDHQGRTYASFDEWKHKNQLPSGTFSYPDGFRTGPGHRTVTANTPQTGQQEAWSAADNTVLGVGIASQLVQKIPHPVAVAAGTVGSGLTLGYVVLRGSAGLHDQHNQGRPLDPISNPSTIPNYLNIASGVLPGVAQTSKYLGSVPAIARSPTLATAVHNVGTGARALDLAADAGQVGQALTHAVQNPNDPGALLSAALSTSFFAPRAFRTGKELRQALTEAPTRRILNEALSLDYGGPAQNRAAVDTLNQLAQSRGFQDLPLDDRSRLLRYVAGTNTELSAPAREQLQRQFADPAFRSGSPEEQLERLRTFMREQPGLTYTVEPTPGAYRPNATAQLSEATLVPSQKFLSGDKPAHRYTIDVDGRQIPVFVASDPAQPGSYSHTTSEIREAIERMPKVSRDQVSRIMVDNARSPHDEYWARVFNNDNHRAYMSAGPGGELSLFPTPTRQTSDYLTGSIVHETGHFYSGPRWGSDSVNDPGWQNWRNAIASDGFAPSVYGKNNPSEDFSESLNLYASVKGTPREAEIRAIMPQRFRMLDEIWEQRR